MDLLKHIIEEKNLIKNYPGFSGNILNFMDLNIINALNPDMFNDNMDDFFSDLGRYRRKLYFVFNIDNEKISFKHIIYDEKFSRSLRIVAVIKEVFLKMNLLFRVEAKTLRIYDDIKDRWINKNITLLSKL